MAKISTEADMDAIRKRWAEEDAGLRPKKKLTAKEQFNKQMMDQSAARVDQALRPKTSKKPLKPKY